MPRKHSTRACTGCTMAKRRLQHPSISHNNIAAFFSSKYGLNIEKSTITKILSQQKKWLSSETSTI
ncbi:177_t:CDS:2, partial [Diversispora eburnea]